MKDHNKDINNTITELLLSCLEHPISVYLDLDRRIVVSSENEREARWLWKNWKYEHVIDMDRNTGAGVVKNTILDKLENLEKDFPIPTSLRNTPITWEEE